MRDGVILIVMPRTLITKVKVPATGYNLTDSTDFVTIPAGFGLGVEFLYEPHLLFIAKNPDDSEPPVHLQVPWRDEVLAVGGNMVQSVILVAITKTHVLRIPRVFRQPNGMSYVDCFFEAIGLLIDIG